MFSQKESPEDGKASDGSSKTSSSLKKTSSYSPAIPTHSNSNVFSHKESMEVVEYGKEGTVSFPPFADHGNGRDLEMNTKGDAKGGFCLGPSYSLVLCTQLAN